MAKIGKTILRDIETDVKELTQENLLTIANLLFPVKQQVVYVAYAQDNETLSINIIQYILDNEYIQCNQNNKRKRPAGILSN